ncbi:MAG: hypothetical protein MUC47_11040 [Candidatus Kapabacteria bacterium]|nr:hypothetical protein [Candidatus Kapabacteria bacterium]
MTINESSSHTDTATVADYAGDNAMQTTANSFLNQALSMMCCNHTINGTCAKTLGHGFFVLMVERIPPYSCVVKRDDEKAFP